MPELQEFDPRLPAWGDPRLGFHHSYLVSPESWRRNIWPITRSTATFTVGPITADVTTTLAGLDDMQLTLAGGTTTTLARREHTAHRRHVSLDPVNTTAVLELKPVSTRPASTARPGRPHAAGRRLLRPRSSSAPARDEGVHPLRAAWSWSVLGFELFSLTVRGELTTHLRPDRVDPVVIDG